jgi:acetylornithine/succinyldiaminopimelate/putrescine aminotransferase
VKHNKAVNGNDLADVLARLGVLSKATHTYTLRLAPPLTINEKQVMKACNTISRAVYQTTALHRERRKELPT